MFQKRIIGDVYLRLLEERHAPAAFAAVERDREYLLGHPLSRGWERP